MCLHAALEVRSFDTYGFECRGLFVKEGHCIQKGEVVWWSDPTQDAPMRTYTKQEILSAPTTRMTLLELDTIMGRRNRHAEYRLDATAAAAAAGVDTRKGDDDDKKSSGCKRSVLQASLNPQDIVIANPRETLITYSYMLEDDCFGTTPFIDEEDSYFYNHSCNPNTAYQGENRILALSPILSNEQVVYDYAFTETQDSLHAGMNCQCGSTGCRGKLEFLQYKDPVFIHKHYNHCTSLIQRKMRENGWVHDRVVRRCHCSLVTTTTTEVNAPVSLLPQDPANSSKKGSYGVFACSPIPRGTPVIIFSGKIIEGKHIESISKREQEMCLQIDEDLWQIPNMTAEAAALAAESSSLPVLQSRPPEEATAAVVVEHVWETGDYISHSCNPNCGMLDATRVVTMRDIAVNEELTFDYAMVNTGNKTIPAETFECHCGGKDGTLATTTSTSAFPCRGTISAEDYKLVGNRFVEYLSPFVRDAYLAHMTEN